METSISAYREVAVRILRFVKNLSAHPSFYFMRAFGRFSAVRRIGEHLRPARIHSSAKVTSHVFKNVRIDDAIRNLESEGYCTGFDLPLDVLTSIEEYAKNEPTFANLDPSLGFYYSQRQIVQERIASPILRAGYFNVSSRNHAIADLQRDPLLIEIARRYLKSEPVLLGTPLWWSFPVDAEKSDRSRAAQLFHFDLDGFRFIKFFFYITNVDEDAGPHVFVRGTHRSKRVRHEWILNRVVDADVIQSYGAENVVRFTGARGTGFAEDTFGLHKGEAPTKRDRLILQLEFGRCDYGLNHDRIDPRQMAMIDLEPGDPLLSEGGRASY